MADIFLSYAREDEARAAAVAQVLGALGWSVFWDRRIVAGTSWDDVIERELEVSRCVVVLWSATSVASRWVRTEAHVGLQRNLSAPNSVLRVARGGSFSNSYSAVRAATRGRFSPSIRDSSTGFRVAVSCFRS